MHIAEGFLPPLHAAAWTAVATPFVIHGTREIGRTIKAHPEAKLLLGAAGAFTFVLSAIKRDRGVKDWGTLIEGHGGMLDRVDSISFSAPIFFRIVRYWWV